MNCQLSNEYFAQAFERAQTAKKGNQPLRQHQLLLLYQVGTGSDFKFNTKSQTLVHPREIRLDNSDDFIAVGFALGYYVVPKTVKNGVEVETFGKTPEIINWGDPRTFGENYLNYETLFDARLTVKTNGVDRVENLRTSCARFVPPIQIVAEKEVAIRRNYDDMVQLEPFIRFEGGIDNHINVDFVQTLADLNTIADHNVYAAMRLDGFLDRDVRRS